MESQAHPTTQTNQADKAVQTEAQSLTAQPNLAGPLSSDDFTQEAGLTRPSLLTEFCFFLLHNKKWWLTPIILVLLLVGLLAVLGGTAAAPFIYTLF